MRFENEGGAEKRTIVLYATDTMADWEYADLPPQISSAEQLKPGRFRLLLVGDGLKSMPHSKPAADAGGRARRHHDLRHSCGPLHCGGHADHRACPTRWPTPGSRSS